MLKIASIAAWIGGLGFGIPGLIGIWSLINGKGIAYVMGFPTYGQGPFEKIGVHTTIPLMLGFLLTCVLECIAGWMLWQSDKGGAMLSIIIIPIEIFFYIGFALPFGPAMLLLRIVFLVLGWGALHTIN